MRVRDSYQLPQDKQELRRKVVRLEWITIGVMLSVVVVLYFALGSSQAMKTAWIEDILSLIPPIAILIAIRFEGRPPDEQYPYGYYRAVSIAFLCAAVALTAMGLFLFYDALTKLARMEHPTIGTVSLFGHTLWMGWVMIAALVYSVVPPMILGRLKLPLAEQLHDKALHADAAIDRADWLTGLAAMLGVLGIGLGWWWADAVAAAVIALDIVWDGGRNLVQVIRDLMDHVPVSLSRRKPLELPDRIRDALRTLDWVEDAEVRLREEGHVLTGEAFVIPREWRGLGGRLSRVNHELALLDWRLYDLTLVPVLSLEHAAENVGSRDAERQSGRAEAPDAAARRRTPRRSPARLRGLLDIARRWNHA